MVTAKASGRHRWGTSRAVMQVILIIDAMMAYGNMGERSGSKVSKNPSIRASRTGFAITQHRFLQLWGLSPLPWSNTIPIDEPMHSGPVSAIYGQ
jgi:hypothetical protein